MEVEPKLDAKYVFLHDQFPLHSLLCGYIALFDMKLLLILAMVGILGVVRIKEQVSCS